MSNNKLTSLKKTFFFSVSQPTNYLTTQLDECYEKRVYYRLISGLHTSINIHLSARYLHKGHLNQADYWGPSIKEFIAKFGHEETNGQGIQWLRNLYFIYLVELRALAKVAPYLEREIYYTGNQEDDEDTKAVVKSLLEIIKNFKNHFDESKMFRGNKQEALKLKNEVQLKFRNITRIMDCVGCEKCRLWGKLQTTALGTALKILFSGKKIGLETTINTTDKQKFQLTRTEVLALFNGFGRLSTSISELDNFRNLLATKPTQASNLGEL